MRPAARPTSSPASSPSRCGRSLGQSFVVENKPGAFGILAIEEMARARADGYTLQVGNVSTNAITPVIVAEQVQDQLRAATSRR